eukprot:scaffold17889_cov171-Isochrysis_galbana.AAC.2
MHALDARRASRAPNGRLPETMTAGQRIINQRHENEVHPRCAVRVLSHIVTWVGPQDPSQDLVQ